MVMAGNVQIGSGGEFSLRNMPVYVQNAERAGYDVFLTGCFNFPPLLFLIMTMNTISKEVCGKN